MPNIVFYPVSNLYYKTICASEDQTVKIVLIVFPVINGRNFRNDGGVLIIPIGNCEFFVSLTGLSTRVKINKLSYNNSHSGVLATYYAEIRLETKDLY